MKESDFDGFVWENLQRVHRKDYMKWRAEVLSKYDYTCQKTKIRGGKLNVHHIFPWSKHPEKRFDVDNGIVLSEREHINFHKKYGYTNCTPENLEEFLKEGID
jgi:5-methylcytosine-specific restriction endonuclease McrA